MASCHAKSANRLLKEAVNLLTFYGHCVLLSAVMYDVTPFLLPAERSDWLGILCLRLLFMALMFFFVFH